MKNLYNYIMNNIYKIDLDILFKNTKIKKIKWDSTPRIFDIDNFYSFQYAQDEVLCWYPYNKESCLLLETGKTIIRVYSTVGKNIIYRVTLNQFENIDNNVEEVIINLI